MTLKNKTKDITMTIIKILENEHYVGLNVCVVQGNEMSINKALVIRD